MPIFVCDFEGPTNLPDLYFNADITADNGVHAGLLALSLDGIRAFGGLHLPPFLRSSIAIWTIPNLTIGLGYTFSMWTNSDHWQGGDDPDSIVPLEVNIDDGVSGAVVTVLTHDAAGWQLWTSSTYLMASATLTVRLATSPPVGQGIGTWAIDDVYLSPVSAGTIFDHMANAHGRTFLRVPWYNDAVTGTLLPHGRVRRDHEGRLVDYLDVDDFGRDDNLTGYAPPEKDPKEP